MKSTVSTSLALAVLFSLDIAAVAFVNPLADGSSVISTRSIQQHDAVPSPSLALPSSHNKGTATTTVLKYSTTPYQEESEWYSPPPPAPKKKEPEQEDAPRLPRGVSPKVSVIRSRIDFEEFLLEDDRLCVVKFHAAWCKSCQKFGLHFNKLVADNADWEKQGVLVKENKVRFAEVEWGANTQLCKELGIKKLPSTFFYSGGTMVHSMAAGPKKFALVRDAVQRYVSKSPAELQFEAELEKGKKLMEETARMQRFEEVSRARRLQRRATTRSAVSATWPSPTANN